MHLISNQQKNDVVDFLTQFIALTADNGNNRIYNLKRRSGLLIKKLKANEEIDNELVKELRASLKK